MAGVPCEALTAKGQPCRRAAQRGSNPPRCAGHAQTSIEQTAERIEAAKLAYLDAYRRTRSQLTAAAVIGYDLRTVNRWGSSDRDFRDRVQALTREGVEAMLDALYARGLGCYVEETTTTSGVGALGPYKSTKTVSKWVASDRAAELWLLGHDPDRYATGAKAVPSMPRDPNEEARTWAVLSDPQASEAIDRILNAELDKALADLDPK